MATVTGMTPTRITQEVATQIARIVGLENIQRALAGSVFTTEDLPPGPHENGITYLVLSTGNLWAWKDAQWSNVGSIIGDRGPKGDPGAPGSLGITFVESLAEAEALPVGTLYAIVAKVTTPPTDLEIPDTQVTVAGIASANANTAVIAPTIEEAQPGDTIILAVNTKSTSGVTLTPPEGFITAVNGYWVGTQRSWVLHGTYTPGMQFTFSAEQETAWVAIAVRGAQSINVGLTKGRAEAPADTDTTTTAPAVSKRDLDLVLGLVFERTTSAESASQVNVSAGWEKIAWQGHGQNVQTVLVARATAGGKLVATYPNPQEQNSMGVQVACRA